MAKIGKLIIVLGCLVCVLAIFIAPMVDSPETVLPKGPAVHAAGSQISIVPLQVAEASALVQHILFASSHSSSTARSRGPAIARKSSVMRC